jgi:hypothetical protein
LNPDLLYQPSMLNLGFERVVVPSFTIVLVFAAASWIVLLVLGVLTDWQWERRISRLTKTLALRDHEILQLKASAFDQLQDILRARMPAPDPEPPAVVDRRPIERRMPSEPQPTTT